MKQGHLLLVEDDMLILRSMGKGLRDAGYRVCEAESADEAIQVCKDAQPDLAILDIRMGELSGLELGHWLAERDIPFMFLTAYDDESYVREANEAGALGYLVKPVDFPKLIPSLETALARAQELKQLRDSEDKLVSALKTNREISIVVGLLMARHDLTAEQAFERLRQQARQERRKVLEVAQDVLTESNQDRTSP